MDPILEEYLDRKFAELMACIEAWRAALAGRLDRIDRHVARINDGALDALEGRADQLEQRALEAERRLGLDTEKLPLFIMRDKKGTAN